MIRYHNNEIHIIGLGYVGLTLAAAFLSENIKVCGVERRQHVCDQLRSGIVPFKEEGLSELFSSIDSDTFRVVTNITGKVDTAVICVGTPYDISSSQPLLGDIVEAIEMLACHLTNQSIVIIRSTVPIGTTREFLKPALERNGVSPQIVYAPERTIQGVALSEVLSLPQLIGTESDEHYEQAARLFQNIGLECVRLSSFEAAEMAKLIGNAHTDLLYGFGNEVAEIAQAFQLDALEIIQAANWSYPRPSIQKPGFVGGSCLTKDPYHLIYSAQSKGYQPYIVPAARRLNEALTERIFLQLDEFLVKENLSWESAKVLLAGAAYKGFPETDDVRGSMLQSSLKELAKRDATGVKVQDFVVKSTALEEMGLSTVTWEEGLLQSDIIILMNNHASYHNCVNNESILMAKQRCVIYDVWGNIRDVVRKVGNSGITYKGVGFHG